MESSNEKVNLEKYKNKVSVHRSGRQFQNALWLTIQGSCSLRFFSDFLLTSTLFDEFKKIATSLILEEWNNNLKKLKILKETVLN